MREIEMSGGERDSSGPASDRDDVNPTEKGTTLGTDLQVQNVDSSSPFDRIRRFDEKGGEFWDAREMVPLMGYSNWEHFKGPIRKGEISAKAHGFSVETLFTRIRERGVVDGNEGRPRENVRLTRRACYLVAMNCDPSKPEVAAAQNYFAERTRESEVRPMLSAVEIGVEVAKAMIPVVDRLDRSITGCSTDIARLNERMTAIEGRVASPLVEEKYMTIYGYCQDRGIKTNKETNRLHTDRLKKIVARENLPIVPRIVKIKESEWSIYHWPVSFLDRYFSHEANRTIAMRNRRIVLFGNRVDVDAKAR